MTLECKYFELNGINLVQFTHRITDSTEPETDTIPKLGDENRQFAIDDRGLRTITWEGYVSNDEIYLNLRKVLFDSRENPETPSRKEDNAAITGFQKDTGYTKTRRKQDHNNNASCGHKGIQYSKGFSHSGSNIIASGHSDTSEGRAPTTPEWTLTANGTIINPAISNGEDKMEWNGTLDPVDDMVISKDGTVSINGSRMGNISGTVPEADAGENTFFYGDDSGSSHNCTIEVTWNDAYY